MTPPNRIGLAVWLRHHLYESRSWLVLAAAGVLAAALMLGANLPTGRSEVHAGEVVGFTLYSKLTGRSAVVRVAPGQTRMVSLSRAYTCARGDRLRVIETRYLLGTKYRAAPEGCVRPR